MSDRDRPASDVLAAFVSQGRQLDHAAWLLFLHELSRPQWPVGPPPGRSWDELSRAPTGALGQRLDIAVAASGP